MSDLQQEDTHDILIRVDERVKFLCDAVPKLVLEDKNQWRIINKNSGGIKFLRGMLVALGFLGGIVTLVKVFSV
jgi:hypothetical protein